MSKICTTVTEKSKKRAIPILIWGLPMHIGMGRDMSIIFQIGESPYRYGVHSNLGTNIHTYLSLW